MLGGVCLDSCLSSGKSNSDSLVRAWESAFHKHSWRFWFAAGLRTSKVGVLWVILLKPLPIPAASMLTPASEGLGLVCDPPMPKAIYPQV